MTSPGEQRLQDEFLDVCLECFTVETARDHHRSDESTQADSGYQRRALTPVLGHITKRPFAAVRAGIATRHRKVDAGFVEEEQSADVKIGLKLPKQPTSQLYVWPELFRRVNRFFFASAPASEVPGTQRQGPRRRHFVQRSAHKAPPASHLVLPQRADEGPKAPPHLAWACGRSDEEEARRCLAHARFASSDSPSLPQRQTALRARRKFLRHAHGHRRLADEGRWKGLVSSTPWIRTRRSPQLENALVRRDKPAERRG